VLDYKVEIGFENLAQFGTAFTLDDPVKGLLDNTDYPLGGGSVWFDVSEYVQSVSINRGKSRDLDKFTSGQAQVRFTNQNRYFDPTFAASPFFGEIVPRRAIRISTNGLIQYIGVIDDWNLTFDISQESIAECSASDSLAVLAKLNIAPTSFGAELSGARVSAVLDNAGVLWPAGDRDIDAGNMVLGAQDLLEATPALNYLQTVETSEPGSLFISKDGKLTFNQRTSADVFSGVVFADDGTGIRYSNVQVVYGSELLYNQIVATSIITSGTAIADNLASQEQYGISSLSLTDLLVNTDVDLGYLVNGLSGIYGEPELRFEALEFELKGYSDAVQNTLLGLELGQVCTITFTPNGIPPATTEFAKITRINHTITPNSHRLVFGFASSAGLSFILDSTDFGKLDTNALGF